MLLDLQHDMAKRLLGGKLGVAPMDNVQRVLDLGTGTGIWAIEFGARQPRLDCTLCGRMR